MRKEEVMFLNFECLSRSTEHQLVDLSNSTDEFNIIGKADVPKIDFNTNFRIKNAIEREQSL